MSGLGGLNKSKHGVVMGLVQLQLPVVRTPDDLAAQTRRICELVGKARRNLSTMDIVVFPEYALHGLSMDTSAHIMCTLDGPEVAAFRQACVEHRIWGCFSIMEANPGGNPYNSGLIIDDTGAIKLYYRKLHPWVPVEPWEPGNMGIPVCDGPNGSKLSLIICHDGMFPEMAREAAYKGAEIILRTAGYTAPIRHAWKITNQANAFQNLAITASVCLCGSDGSFDSMGEGMFCNFDGSIITAGGARVDEIIRELGAFLKSQGCDVRLKDWKGVPSVALETDPELPPVQRLMSLAGQTRPAGVNYFSDAGVLGQAGIPSVVFGPGASIEAALNVQGAPSALQWSGFLAAFEWYVGETAGVRN